MNTNEVILARYKSLYGDDYLAHYGVIGMKWGIRRDPSKAFARSSRKANSLKKLSVNANLKSAKLRSKALKMDIRAKNSEQYDKANKLRLKANKLDEKSVKYSSNAKKWVGEMEKNFSNVKLVDISSRHFDIGRQYLYMLSNK